MGGGAWPVSIMELIIKHFSELSVQELHEIYKLRVSVFIVEQHCPYQDVDELDTAAYHIFLRDEDGIEAYLRLLPPHTAFDCAALGRVLAVKRRCGLGTRIVSEGIAAARRIFGADTIKLEAQVYARGLYEKCGFVQSSGEFLEDGIPHIEMTWTQES